jgi:hypothetical protein
MKDTTVKWVKWYMWEVHRKVNGEDEGEGIWLMGFTHNNEIE